MKIKNHPPKLAGKKWKLAGKNDQETTGFIRFLLASYLAGKMIKKRQVL